MNHKDDKKGRVLTRALLFFVTQVVLTINRSCFRMVYERRA